MLLRWPPKLEMPLGVEGMAFKCQAGQTLVWDVDGMVGPGCYDTWMLKLVWGAWMLHGVDMRE